jgi:phosphohistidine phosphatase
MEICIMRHGIAARREDWHDRPDRDRPLVAKGENRVRGIARGFRALGLTFDAVLTSGYARALSTAEIVAGELGCGARLRTTPALECGGDPRAVLDELRQHHPDANRILLVGHEPDLSELVTWLIAGRIESRVRMKKGAVCAVRVPSTDLSPPCGSIEWLLAPKHWIAIGEGS